MNKKEKRKQQMLKIDWIAKIEAFSKFSKMKVQRHLTAKKTTNRGKRQPMAWRKQFYKPYII